MRCNKKYIWLLCGCLLSVLATAGKHVINQIGLAFNDTYNSPESRSFVGAKEQGIWLADLKSEPVELASENITFEFQEAWLEAAYEPSNFLIWFPGRKRAKWNYLCVRPKTLWFQDSFQFVLVPQFDREFVVTGRGRNGADFTLSGDDLYFQKVPTDLQRFKIKVSIFTYGNAKDFTLGTASFNLPYVE